jgi:hypothetical protein
MRRDQLIWLVLIYLFLFIVGYWPQWAKARQGQGRAQEPKAHVYSIPVTVQMNPRGDS